MDERRRSIIREHEFDEQLARLIPSVEGADDFLAAAEEILSIDPESGTPADKPVWILPMAPVRDREVYLYYSFDEESVFFVWILAL